MLRTRCAAWAVLVASTLGHFHGPRAHAAAPPPRKSGAADVPVPDLRELAAQRGSEMDPVVRRYEADRGSLLRSYTIPSSPTRHARLKRFYASWHTDLQALDTSRLSDEAWRQ